MHVRLISSWEDFQKLEKEWNSLLAESEENPLFASWEWISSWVRIWRNQIVPYVLVVTDCQNNLIGIAPFYLSSMYFLGVVKLRTLRVMGDFSSGSEYGDVIAHRQDALEIKRRIFYFLESMRQDWDCLFIKQLPGWKSSSTMKALSLSNQIYFRSRDRTFSYVPLPKQAGDLQSGFSKNLQGNLRRFENGLSGAEEVVIKCDTAEGLKEYLPQLFDLHQRRWAIAGEAGTFIRTPGLRRFYEEFTHCAFENGWLRLFVLNVDGVARAVQIGYRHGDIFYVIQEGFDPEFRKGIGNVLRAKVLAECVEEGVREYDFMAGFSEHKRRWGARKRGGYDLLVYNKNMRNFLLSRDIWPGGRLLQLESYSDESISL